ncbi:hypothetical protein GCM10022214_55590 [Actinomadura miaoliensis]|uniref:Uncharacterized protein n=1 Tax=Actinomadura miaoliensis TaxID=430685 RepID=A0ABP7WGR5_9ACTN
MGSYTVSTGVRAAGGAASEGVPAPVDAMVSVIPAFFRGRSAAVGGAQVCWACRALYPGRAGPAAPAAALPGARLVAPY